MGLRDAVLGIGIGLGATTAANRLLSWSVDPLDAPFEGRDGTFRLNGTAVAYTEAGDVDNPTVVMLHGMNAAASSAEYLRVFYALSDDYHVVAVDLPGFGRSDRSPVHYDDDYYERFLHAFLDQYEDVAVIASGITAAYAADVAPNLETDVSSLTLVCPSTGAMPDQPWLERLVRSPIVGTALMNLATSRLSIERSNADHAYSDPSSAPDSLTDYEWRSAHQPNAKYAVAAFVAGRLNMDVDLAARIDALDAPVTLVWGGDAETTTVDDSERLADETHATITVVEDAKLLPHVEHPDDVLPVLRTTVDQGIDTAADGSTDNAGDTNTSTDHSDADSGESTDTEDSVDDDLTSSVERVTGDGDDTGQEDDDGSLEVEAVENIDTED